MKLARRTGTNGKAGNSLVPFWAGYALSQSGTAAWRLALPWVTLEKAGSVWALAGTSLAVLLPELLFGPLAGALADLLPRLPTLVSLDTFRFALYGGAALTSAACGGWGGLTYLLTAVLAVDALLNMLYTSARSAVLKELAGQVNMPLKSLIGTDRAVRNLADIVGMTVGGIVIASFPVTVMLVGNAISFAVGGAGVALTWALFPADARWARPTSRPASHGSFALEGVHVVRRDTVIRDAVLRQLAVNLPIPLLTLGLPLALTSRGVSGALLGLSSAGFAVGSLAVSLTVRRHRSASIGAQPRRSWLVLATGAALIAIVFHLPLAAIPFVFALLGAAFTWVLLDANMQWQTRLEAAVTGRVAALCSMAARIAALSVTVAVPLATELGSDQMVLSSAALVVMLAAAAGWRQAPAVVSEEPVSLSSQGEQNKDLAR